MIRLSRFLTLTFFIAWFVWLRPPLLGGGTSFIMVSGTSMEPDMVTGDLVIVRRQPIYQVGDAVAFNTGGGNVIHRIVGGNAREGFIMQGDNRPSVDPWTPTPDQIIGKQWLFFPGVGRTIETLWQQPLALAVLMSLLLVGSLDAATDGRLSRRRRRYMERRKRMHRRTRILG